VLVDSTQTQHIIRDLTPFRVYAVYVSAINEIGQGDVEEAVIETRETGACAETKWPLLENLKKCQKIIKTFAQSANIFEQ